MNERIFNFMNFLSWIRVSFYLQIHLNTYQMIFEICGNVSHLKKKAELKKNEEKIKIF